MKPDSAEIIALLIALYAEQKNIKITYKWRKQHD